MCFSHHSPHLNPSSQLINFPISKQTTAVCDCDKFTCIYVLHKLYLISVVIWLALLRITLILLTKIRFVTFNTNHCQLRTTITYDVSFISLSLTILPLLLSNTDDIIAIFQVCDGRIVVMALIKYFINVIKLMIPWYSILTKIPKKLIFVILIMYLNLTYSSGVIMTILLIKILNTISQLCHFIPIWVPFLVIVMSNDTERNPGDNNLFTFCNWNLNSLTKDNFGRLNLLEAHNSLFNYDIISLCETNLNDTIELPINPLNGFKSIYSHHPSGNKHGGVAIFYKEILPLFERNDLSFD